MDKICYNQNLLDYIVKLDNYIWVRNKLKLYKNWKHNI